MMEGGREPSEKEGKTVYIEEVLNGSENELEYGCSIERLMKVAQQGDNLVDCVSNEGLRESLRDCFSSIVNYCENIRRRAEQIGNS